MCATAPNETETVERRGACALTPPTAIPARGSESSARAGQARGLYLLYRHFDFLTVAMSKPSLLSSLLLITRSVRQRWKLQGRKHSWSKNEVIEVQAMVGIVVVQARSE